MILFFKQLFTNFKQDRCTQHAAALSFSSLLALAPILAIAFGLLSIFAPLEAMGENLENFIYQYLVPDAGLDIRQHLSEFTKQTGNLTSVGLLSFLFTAIFLLNNIENSLNIIWKTQVHRSYVQRFKTYWVLLTLGPILMGAGLSISTYALSLNIFNRVDEIISIKLLLLKILPIMFEVAAFLVLYIIMPNKEIMFRNALIGAVIAALLFEITKRLFAIFILNFNNYEVIYGTLATLPIFLIWIYLSWLITLFGAEIVVTLGERKRILIENNQPD